MRLIEEVEKRVFCIFIKSRAEDIEFCRDSKAGDESKTTVVVEPQEIGGLTLNA